MMMAKGRFLGGAGTQGQTRASRESLTGLLFLSCPFFPLAGRPSTSPCSGLGSQLPQQGLWDVTLSHEKERSCSQTPGQ